MQAALSKQNVSVLADGLFFKEKNAAVCHFFLSSTQQSNDCFIDLKH